MNIKLYIRPTEVPIVQLPKEDKLFADPWWITLVRIDFNLNGVDYSIRPGFITNLGSVPKRLRHIVDPDDESLLAFIIHDYLYSKNVAGIAREDADKAMREIAIMCGQDKVEAYVTWIGVRLGGWTQFNKNEASFKRVSNNLIARICADNDYIPTKAEIENLLGK